jgi:hypothetical protein
VNLLSGFVGLAGFLAALPARPAAAGAAQAIQMVAVVLHVVPALLTLGGAYWSWRAVSRRGEPALGPAAGRMARGLPRWAGAAIATGYLASGVAGGSGWAAVSGPSRGRMDLSPLPAALAGFLLLLAAAKLRRPAAPPDAPAPGQPVWLRLLAFGAFGALALAALHCVANAQCQLSAGAACGDIHPAALLVSGGDRIFLPRYLHLLLGSACLAGAWAVWLAGGAVGRGEAGAGHALDWATAGFCIAMVLELVAGLWLLGLLPLAAGRAFVGGELLPTAALLLSLALALWAIRVAWRARLHRDPRRTTTHLVGLTAALAALMAVLRATLHRS